MNVAKNKYLAFQVLLAIIAGVATGFYFPEAGIKLQFIATDFVKVVELFTGPVIFLSVVIGIGNVGGLRQLGRIGLKSLLYFEIVTTLALIVGLTIAAWMQPGSIDKTHLVRAMESNRLSERTGYWAVSHYMFILLCAALLTGILLNYYKEKKRLLHWAELIRDGVFAVLSYIFWLVPLAVFSGLAFVVGRYGLHTLLPLGRMIASVYLTTFLFVFIVLGAVLYYFRIHIWAVLRLIKEELLIVLGTSSSRSVLPLIIHKLEGAGCSKTVAGFVMSVGYFLNLTGTSIYMAMGMMFLAQLYKVELSFSEISSLLLLLIITSKAASGVPGAGFVALTITVATFHKVPMEGLAVLLSIDRFLNEARAMTNTIGNTVAAIVIARNEGNQIVLEKEEKE